MNKSFVNWLIFIALSFIWGSSFILMKLGITCLTAYQVAALRIFSSGVVLLPMALRFLQRIPADKLLLVLLSGVIGNFIPAFLFCIAEEKIDSALVGTLNTLTPIFVIITGAAFFKTKTSGNKIIGIAIALTGSFLLLLSSSHINEKQEFAYLSLVVLATFLYGFNVNMVYNKLTNISSFQIVAVALAFNAIPALVILIFTGFFNLPFANRGVEIATGSAVVLGVIGTAIATILFYKLMKNAGGIFASMVTYGIPFIAIGWGLLDGETFGWKQLGSLLVILSGVYWANKPQ